MTGFQLCSSAAVYVLREAENVLYQIRAESAIELLLVINDADEPSVEAKVHMEVQEIIWGWTLGGPSHPCG